MTNKQLVDYIREKVGAGYNVDTIRRVLYKWGYNINDIDEAIYSLYQKQEKPEKGGEHTHKEHNLLELFFEPVRFLILFFDTYLCKHNNAPYILVF